MRTLMAVMVLGAVAAAWPRPAGGDGARPHVAVRFDLEAPDYVNAFTREERDTLEKDAAARAATVLNERFPFLVFVADRDTSPRLEIRLERLDPTAPPEKPQEVGLHMGLVIEGADYDSCYWKLRDDSGDTIGSWSGLSLDVQSCVERADEQTMVDQLLSHVSIADSSLCWPDPVAWVLPYRQEDLCIEPHSRVAVEADVPSGGGPMEMKFETDLKSSFNPPSTLGREEYRGRVWVVAEATPSDLALVQGHADSVQTRAVYMLHFLRSRPCRELAGPGSGEEEPQ